MIRIIDRKYWQPPVGPPSLAPPPPAPGSGSSLAPGRPAMGTQPNSFNSAAGLNSQLGNLSLGGKEGKESRLSLGSLRGSTKDGKEGKGGEEGGKKKSFLGKMKW